VPHWGAAGKGACPVARHQPTESILQEREIAFDYRVKYPIGKIRRDPESDSQVRWGAESVPPQEVRQYTLQLKAGADFPAILVRKRDGVLFDGNTRYEAHRAAGLEAIDAYLVDIESDKVAKAISIAINQTQGKRLSKRAILAYLDSMNGSIDADRFTRDTGWSHASLLKYRAVREVNQRLQDAGVTQHRKVDDAVKVHINTVRQTEPFLKFYHLAEASGMKAGDAKTLAKEIRNASSEADMLAILNAEEEKRRPQIEEIKAGLVPSSTVSSMLRLHCGWIVKQGPAKLEDRNLATREESREWLARANRVLTSALLRYNDESDDE
jgi:ParB-like chromosome segregation protein Spo0J